VQRAPEPGNRGAPVIVDGLLAPLLSAVRTVLGWLPTGAPLDVGVVDTVWAAARQFDSLVPIMGPLVAMLGLLSALAGFLVVRVVLVVWNLIYP